MSGCAALAVVFTRPLQLVLVREADCHEVKLNEQLILTDVGPGDWVGFFDWLRSRRGEVVGVRSWLSEIDYPGLRKSIVHHPQVDVMESQIRVWFRKPRSFDETRSDDQDLGMHRLLKTQTGKFVLLYSTESLSSSELANVPAVDVM